MPELVRIDVMAEEYGLPKQSLLTAAREHGYLVCMGRARRIYRPDMPELIRLCQDKQKGQGSTDPKVARTGTSATPEAQKLRQAHQIASKLKKPSAATSTTKAGQVVQLDRKK